MRLPAIPQKCEVYRVYFTKIELHNFGIYKGSHEMSLSNQNGERNITLIGGLNGRGKTTFHDSILIALYGKQALKYIQEGARSYEKLLLDHINKHAADDETYVAVSLTLDDGISLRVERKWRQKDGKLNQVLTVEKNGVADEYLGENWNFYIEEILPFGIAKFFFFNNEKITQLAEDASFEQIKGSIKSAIGISTIEKTIFHLDEVIRRKKKAILEFENSEENQGYREVEEQIAELDKKLAEAIAREKELERNRERAEADYEAADKKFWSAGGDLLKHRDAIKAEMKRITAEVEDINSEMLKIAADPATPLYMCRYLVGQVYESELALRNDDAERYSNKVRAELYRRIIARLDNSEIPAEVYGMVKKIVTDELISQIGSENNLPIEPLSRTSLQLLERLTAEVFQVLDAQINNLTKYMEEQENRHMNLDTHLDEFDEKTVAMQLYDALQDVDNKKKAAENEHDHQKEAIKNMEQYRNTLDKRRINLIRKIAEKQNDNSNNGRIVKYAAMSMEVLSRFKGKLQSEKVAALSEAVTQCFRALVEKDTFIQRIDIHPETLDVTIIGSDGKELLKSQLSAGEQQMFAISIVWALALTSGYKAPVIIDTPMARLDSSHRANFVTKYLPAASSQVLVLSTDEEINGQYLSLIRDNVVDSYTLLYQEEEQCTSIIHGYFGEALSGDCKAL